MTWLSFDLHEDMSPGVWIFLPAIHVMPSSRHLDMPRSNHPEYTRSRLISEVKQDWARLVLRLRNHVGTPGAVAFPFGCRH